MALENRLGRGLDALLGGAQAQQQASAGQQRVQDIRELPLERIVPNSEQARKHFDTAKLEELAASIREQGIVQPLLVSPAGNGQYQLVAGERRWRAAKLAALAVVPVTVVTKNVNDRQVISLIENLQREDLNPMEEASGIQKLMERCQLTQEQAAQKLGKSRSAVANAVRLLTLSGEAQEDLLAGRLSAGHARSLLALPTPSLREALRSRVVTDGLSVRQVEEAVAFHKEHDCFPWEMPASEGDAAALPTDGATKGTGKSRTGGRQPKDAVLRAAALRIADALNCKAKISGDQNKGKITLHYEDTETLVDLLASLGAGGLEEGGA